MGCSTSLVNSIQTESSIQDIKFKKQEFLRFKDRQDLQTNKFGLEPLTLPTSESTILRQEKPKAVTKSKFPSLRVSRIPPKSHSIQNSLQCDNFHPLPQVKDSTAELTLPPLQNNRHWNVQSSRNILEPNSKDYLMVGSSEGDEHPENTFSDHSILSHKLGSRTNHSNSGTNTRYILGQFSQKFISKKLLSSPLVRENKAICRSSQLDDQTDHKLGMKDRASKDKNPQQHDQFNATNYHVYRQKSMLLQQREKKRAHRRYQESCRRSRVSNIRQEPYNYSIPNRSFEPRDDRNRSENELEMGETSKLEKKKAFVPFNRIKKQRSYKLIVNPSFRLNRTSTKHM